VPPSPLPSRLARPGGRCRPSTPALPADAASAITEAYAAAERQPDDPALVGRLAMVLHARKEWEPAAATYRLAQTLAPRDDRWWHLAGLLETRRGRHEHALPLFERAAALAPEDRAVRLRVAEAKLETGDLQGGERLFAELARHPPTMAAAAYGLGRVANSGASAARPKRPRLSSASNSVCPAGLPRAIRWPNRWRRYLFALSAALVRAGNVQRGRVEALVALELARRYGQSDLAATIERDLAMLNN
jgi:tetratricopeptide (TPR) repeat protein